MLSAEAEACGKIARERSLLSEVRTMMEEVVKMRLDVDLT